MNNKYPTRKVAEELLRDAERCNPGPWGDHSRVVAMCAEKIAAACPGMEPEKAYVLGFLHDIGRKYGVKHFGHIYDGYMYMNEMGYGAAARICLSHSFCIQRIEDYIGNFDVTKEQQKVVEDALYRLVFDDYDLLIQLCDAVGHCVVHHFLIGGNGAYRGHIPAKIVFLIHGRIPPATFSVIIISGQIKDNRAAQNRPYL
jgi:hypothetical protein